MRKTILKTLVRTVTPVLVLNFAVVAFATPIANRYAAANMASDLAITLQSRIVPAEFKKNLLNTARPEDRAFVRSILTKWKAYRERDVQAEFDQLIIRDEFGVEVLKIRPDVEFGKTFVINGRIWNKPSTGSIEKSLREFLRETVAQNYRTPSASMFASILNPTLAYAADESAPLTKPAYLYVTLGGFLSGPENLPPTASVLKNSPTDIIEAARPRGWNKFFNDAVIQCKGSTALTSAKIGSEKIGVESRPDGSLILTLNSGAQKTKFFVASKTFDANAVQKAVDRIQSYNDTADAAAAASVLADFDRVGCEALSPGKFILARQKVEKVAAEKATEAADKIAREQAKTIATYLKQSFVQAQESKLFCDDVVIRKCLKEDCSVTSEPSKPGNVFAWIPHEIPRSVGRAKEWTPEDTKVSRKPVTVDPRTDLLVLNGDGVSGNDLRTAKRLVTNANDDENSARSEVKQAILSLRPLGQCCGDSECREKIAAKKLNLVPTSGSGATTR